MYLPPLSAEDEYISSWEYRRSLIQDRIGIVDADIVCFQEVSPLTFEDDFGFMTEHLGYDGVELFHKVIVMACILKMSLTTPFTKMITPLSHPTLFVDAT